MKRLVALAMAAAVAVASQDLFAKAVRLRETVRGSGLAVESGTGGVAKQGKLAAAIPAMSPADAAVALKLALGIEDASRETLEVRSDETDSLGRRHVRLRQLYGGIEVDGRELVVHYAKDGRVYEVNGDWLDGLSIGVEPAIALAGAELVVYCPGKTAASAHLAWKKRAGKNYIFVDALTGKTLHVRRAAPFHAARAAVGAEDDDGDDDDDGFLDLETLVANAVSKEFPSGAPILLTGQLPRQQGGATVTVGATETDGGAACFATVNPDGVEIGVLDGIAAPANREALKTASAANDQKWFDSFTANPVWTVYSPLPDEDMENTFAIVYNISGVLDYYKSAFNRISYDGKGGRVAAWRFWQDEIDDVDSGFENAFWAPVEENGEPRGCFFFGYDLTGRRSETAFDTCAHELTHGITSASANLEYEGESGALNESFSDIVAMAAEFACQPRAEDLENPGPGEADWLFDEDSGEAARSFVQPRRYGQPSRYKGSNWVDTSDVSDMNDCGGVHSNSGVQNHFFYLLSDGGTGTNDGIDYELTGIGVEKAVQIAYRALTAYCVPRTDYSSIADCWDSAAQDLLEAGVLTEEDCAALKPAWDAVLTEPTVTLDGDAIYSVFDYVVRIGAPNRRTGRSRLTAWIPGDDGKIVSFSCWVQDGYAKTYSRKLGRVEIECSPAYALVEFENEVVVLPRVSPLVGGADALGELRVGVGASDRLFLFNYSVDDVKSTRWSAKKLPAGLKVNAKTGLIVGVPRRAGEGTATFSANCRMKPAESNKTVTAKINHKADWSVAPLDNWAQGSFEGDGISVAIGKYGRARGYATVDGKRVRFTAKSYFYCKNGTYYASALVRSGQMYFTVDESGLDATFTFNGETYNYNAARKR